MSVIEALLLGALQGVAEFLPVSSSGHLTVMMHLFDQGEVPLLFDVLLHISTLIVVCIVFRQRIGKLFVSFWRFITRKTVPEDQVNLRIILMMIIASVCTVAVVLPLKDIMEDSTAKLTSVLFLVTAAILILGKFLDGKTGFNDLKTGKASVIAVIGGLIQGIAPFPGISRSGSTITALQAAGLKREDAGELSFLMSIPAILGALLLQIKDLDQLTEAVSFGAVAAGMAASLVVGYFSLVFLMKLVKKGRLFVFSFYLIPLGILGLIFF